MLQRVKLFLNYLRNDRVKEYERILLYAKKQGYELISLRDYVSGNFSKNTKLMILRHDIDEVSNGASKMFSVEKKVSAKASYYFRNSTLDIGLAKSIEEYGSEASLHFETIADYVKRRGIKTKEQLFKEDFVPECINKLKLNLHEFRSNGLQCKTIASHGEFENRLVKTPNNYLTENISSYEELDIQMEAYNKNLIDQINCYISDTVLEINNGYRYGLTPSDAIKKNYSVILFLTHPNHWHYSFQKQLKKMLKVILLAPKFKKESFKRL
jgi:hypothetical protein